MAGRRPVEEAFVARRPAIRLLVVPQRREALEKLVLHATNLRIPIVEVEGGSLTALAGFDGHQGVALVVEPRRFASLDDVLARAAERGEPPFILVLDSLEDPHNVGTLLRSAEAAGVHGVLFPTHRQAPLSPSAVKASAGAIEHLLLCPVDDLPASLSDLHARGVRVAGAEGDAPMTARQSDLRGPLAIVVGSEGQGLGPAVRRRCDLFMRIPMKGVVGSLNAAVAGSIMLFEALAQRDPGASPSQARAAAVAPDTGEGSEGRPSRSRKKQASAPPDASPSVGAGEPMGDTPVASDAAAAATEVPPDSATPEAAAVAPEVPPESATPRKTRARKPAAAVAPEVPPESATPRKTRARKPAAAVAPEVPPESATPRKTRARKPAAATEAAPAPEAGAPDIEEDALLPHDGTAGGPAELP